LILPDQAPLASESYFWKARCQHHWLIEEAAGPVSRGVCKLCGAKRDFFNDPEAVLIDRT
jgi:hypothetical protein